MNAATDNGFTPTQRRILRLLADGKPHTLEEIKATCLWDELGGRAAVHNQISVLRLKLRDMERDVLGINRKGGVSYRLVAYLTGF